MAASNCFDLVVLDSLASLVPARERACDLADAQPKFIYPCCSCACE